MICVLCIYCKLILCTPMTCGDYGPPRSPAGTPRRAFPLDTSRVQIYERCTSAACAGSGCASTVHCCFASVGDRLPLFASAPRVKSRLGWEPRSLGRALRRHGRRSHGRSTLGDLSRLIRLGARPRQALFSSVCRARTATVPARACATPSRGQRPRRSARPSASPSRGGQVVAATDAAGAPTGIKFVLDPNDDWDGNSVVLQGARSGRDLAILRDTSGVNRLGTLPCIPRARAE